MAWSRSILFKSAFLGSAVGVIIPLLVALLTQLENVAIWLGARAAVQLLVAGLPSPIHTLLQSQGGEMAGNEIEAISRRAPVYLLLLSGLIFVAVLAAATIPSAPVFSYAPPSLKWSLALFAAAMFLSSSAQGVLRVVQRGDIIYAVSQRELLLSLLILPALYIGFSAFLLAAAAKEAWKAAMVLPSFGRPDLQLPHWRTLLAGKSQYFRGLAQVATQYLERTAYPFLFGLATAGKLGLGSTLGILPVMISSNMYLWAFRRVAEGDDEARAAVIEEWSYLLPLAASFCWWLVAAGAVLELGVYGSLEVAIAASFTATMGVGFLALARSRQSLLGTSSSLLHLAMLALAYATVAVVSWLGAGVLIALVSGLGVNTAYTVAVAVRMPSPERRMIVSHAVAAIAALVAFPLLAPVQGSLDAALAASLAAALTAPYAVALYKRRRQ